MDETVFSRQGDLYILSTLVSHPCLLPFDIAEILLISFDLMTSIDIRPHIIDTLPIKSSGGPKLLNQ